MQKRNRPIEDLSGIKNNLLTAISFTGEFKNRCLVWLCICDCGKFKEVPSSRFKNGQTKSCGCIMGNKLDLSNKRFGKLVAIKSLGVPIGKKSVLGNAYVTVVIRQLFLLKIYLKGKLHLVGA
jgi:hypothetical protein